MNISKVALAATITSLIAACGGGSSGSSTPSSSSAVSSVVSSSMVSSTSSQSSLSSSSADSSVSFESSSSSAHSSSSSVSSVSSSSSSSGAQTSTGLSCEFVNTVQGFASIDDNDASYNVTGGADVGQGNYEVRVTDGVALRNAVYGSASLPYQDKPLTIYVEGLITWANSNNADIRIERSNVSIIGLGPDAGFEGVGIELRPRNASTPVENIVIRNLKMRLVPQANGSGDIISLDGRNGPIRNVWINHNELHNNLTPPAGATCANSGLNANCDIEKDYYDELVSGRANISNITISYNYLHDSWKTSLWGSSDGAVENVGRRVTFHHNHWHKVNSRLPLYRYGFLHMFNNYYNDVTGTGINARMGARALIDGNVFESVRNPIVSIDSPVLGYWTVGSNEFANSFTGITTSTGSCTSGTPPCYGAHAISTDSSPYVSPYEYDAALLPTAEAKAHVIANAGAGIIEECL